MLDCRGPLRAGLLGYSGLHKPTVSAWLLRDTLEACYGGGGGGGGGEVLKLIRTRGCDFECTSNNNVEAKHHATMAFGMQF